MLPSRCASLQLGVRPTQAEMPKVGLGVGQERGAGFEGERQSWGGAGHGMLSDGRVVAAVRFA